MSYNQKSVDTTAKILRHNNQQQEEQHQQQQDHNNSISINPTDPGVLLDLERIREAYNEVLGPLNSFIAHYIERLMKAGMQADVIINALHQTAWAKWPSAFYFRAVTQNYLADGILTRAQLDHYIIERRGEQLHRAGEREDKWYE